MSIRFHSTVIISDDVTGLVKSMAIPLIILGTGGNCIDIFDAVNAQNSVAQKYSIIGFLDDNPPLGKNNHCGLPVLGTLADALKFEHAFFVNGIGSPDSFQHKQRCIESTHIPAERFATIVHPRAVVSPSATLGVGTVVLANTTVCARAVIGNHVIILPGCVVSHHCRIADYVVVASGATICGNVTLQSSCYVGAGSVILGDRTVSSQSLIGAGSVVTRDVPAGMVVCGNPAKRHDVGGGKPELSNCGGD